jgi:hypothetical protein
MFIGLREKTSLRLPLRASKCKERLVPEPQENIEQASPTIFGNNQILQPFINEEDRNE